MVNDFVSVKDELVEVKYSGHIRLPTSSVEKCGILIWIKAKKPLFKRPHEYTEYAYPYSLYEAFRWLIGQLSILL